MSDPGTCPECDTHVDRRSGYPYWVDRETKQRHHDPCPTEEDRANWDRLMSDGATMSQGEATAEGVVVTDCHEWAIRCEDRDGGEFTGRPFTSRREAEESGARLTQINDAEWWLISRRREVRVETSPWSRVIPPAPTEREAGR